MNVEYGYIVPTGSSFTLTFQGDIRHEQHYLVGRLYRHPSCYPVFPRVALTRGVGPPGGCPPPAPPAPRGRKKARGVFPAGTTAAAEGAVKTAAFTPWKYFLQTASNI